MKILALICLCLTCLAGQQTPADKPAPAGQTNQQKARAVLDQMIQALGGQAYLNVQDSYAEGRSGSFHNESLVGEGLIYRYWKWPDIDRVELTKERDIVELYIGDNAYEITYRGIRALDPAKDDRLRALLLRRHYSLEIVLRKWLSEPDTLLLYEGQTLSENRMAEKISVINANHEAVTILVAPDTHLPLEKRFSSRDPRYRERDEEATIYGNWRVEQGINTPHTILTKRNGENISQQILSHVTYNTHPSANLFDPSAAKISRVK